MIVDASPMVRNLRPVQNVQDILLIMIAMRITRQELPVSSSPA